MRSIALSTWAALAAALPAQSWQLMAPLTPPPLMRSGAMAFDGTANRLLLHGGLTQSPTASTADTWSYNGQIGRAHV